MKRSIAAAAALAAGLGALGLPAFAAESSCLSCHASESRMKALFVPPALVQSEGEG